MSLPGHQQKLRHCVHFSPACSHLGECRRTRDAHVGARTSVTGPFLLRLGSKVERFILVDSDKITCVTPHRCRWRIAIGLFLFLENVPSSALQLQPVGACGELEGQWGAPGSSGARGFSSKLLALSVGGKSVLTELCIRTV